MSEVVKMEQVFPVEVVKSGDVAVDGRLLMRWLGKSDDQFNRNIKRAIDNAGLVENVDYQVLDHLVERSNEGGSNRIEYVFHPDSAKDIAMMDSSEKGQEVRSYFRKCEEVAIDIIDTPKFIQTQESKSVDDWTNRSQGISTIADLCGYSDEKKKRMVIEIGFSIEVSDDVTIVPTDMKRDFILGSDSVDDEGVAKIEWGGEVVSPTYIAEHFGVYASDVNIALVKIGLQTRFTIGQAHYYRATPKADKYCVTSKHRTSTPHAKDRGVKEYTKISGWKIDLIFDKLEIYFKNN